MAAEVAKKSQHSPVPPPVTTTPDAAVPQQQLQQQRAIAQQQQGQTSMMMPPMEDYDDGEGRDWAKITFITGLVAAALILLWLCALQYSASSPCSTYNNNNNMLETIFMMNQERLAFPIYPTQTSHQMPPPPSQPVPVHHKAMDDHESGPYGPPHGPAKPIQPIQQERFTSTDTFSFLVATAQTIVVIVGCISLAPAIKCYGLKLLSLTCFVGIGCSFLVKTIYQTMDVIAVLKLYAHYKLHMKQFESPTQPGYSPPPTEYYFNLNVCTPGVFLTIAFVTLFICALLTVSLIMVVVFGILAHFGDFTTAPPTSGNGGSKRSAEEQWQQQQPKWTYVMAGGGGAGGGANNPVPAMQNNPIQSMHLRVQPQQQQQPPTYSRLEGF